MRLGKEARIMGKVKLLFDVVADMRSLADSLQAVAEAITEHESVEAPAENTGKKTKKAEAGKTTKAETKADTMPAQDERPMTLAEVRAVLAEKSRAGHTAEIRELLLKHGAEKLSDIDPAEYPSLLTDAEVL